MYVLQRGPLTVALALPALCSAEDANSELTKRFQDWVVRTHAGTFERLSTAEIGAGAALDDYLLSHGPSVVPMIVETLQKCEQDSFRESFVWLFLYCSRADLFSTTTDASKVDLDYFGILPLSESGDLPALRDDRGFALLVSDKPFEMRDVILAWWDQAPTLLASNTALDALRALPIHEDLLELEKRFSILESTEKDSASNKDTPPTASDEVQRLTEERNKIWLHLWLIHWYGIFNLPRFIDIIEQGENGLA